MPNKEENIYDAAISIRELCLMNKDAAPETLSRISEKATEIIRNLVEGDT